MAMVENLLTQHMDLWTSAIKRKSSAGRGSSKKIELYGVKKLRELILELAVRGLLVPQDANDEPASELLKKITAEKAKRVKAGIAKTGKALPKIDGNSQQELPSGWSWACMAELGEIAPRNEVEDDVIASFVPMPLISTRFDGRHEHEPRAWAEIKKGYTHFADGDVAIAKITPCFENSKAAIFSGLNNGIGAGTTELHVARPYGEYINRNYLLLYLKSPQFLRVGETKMTGSAGQKRVPTEFFSFNPLPLPPLPEQHRIVAKVDELMALCDQLEAQTEDSLAAHQTLVESLLNALTQALAHPVDASASADGRASTSAARTAFDEAWQRIADHFDILFTTEQSIDQLKQTILQLAVMGKLVPQDPRDEPASELLKKIAAEKAKLVKEGKIKKEKPLPPITEEEKPFVLPEGWALARLGEIIKISSGDGLTSTQMASDGKIPVYGGNGINGHHNACNVEKQTLVIGRVGFYCGSIHITPDRAWVTDNAFITSFSDEMFDIRYLAILLKRTDLKENENATAQPVISGKKVYPIPVIFPPKPEQHRIVAKVDELMALCDQLKARLNHAQTTQLHLADAITEQALA